jgi:hypothetical protein
VSKKLPNRHGVSDVSWVMSSECFEFRHAAHIECAVGLGALTISLSRSAVNLFPQTVLVAERSSRTLPIVEEKCMYSYVRMC